MLFLHYILGNNYLIHKECEGGSENVVSPWYQSRNPHDYILSCSGLKDSVKNAMAAECFVCQTLLNKGEIQQCQNLDDLFREETILFQHGKQ